jgi:nucleotide-binding universal stress UspA family protein
MPHEPQNARKIIYALDFAPAARMEAQYAVTLSRLLAAELTLFHAIHMPADQLHPTAEFEHSGDFRLRQEQSRKEMQRMIQDQDADVPCKAHIVRGDPAEALQQFCSDHAVDLVISGSRGVKGFKRLLLGTVVERLVRMSACPILVIRRPQRPPGEIMKIGICCDFKADNALLVQWGQELARAFNARVCLLHCMDSAVDESIIDPAQAPYGQVQHMLQERLTAKLLALFACHSSYRPLVVSAYAAHGSVKDRLLGMVLDLAVDLLIVGVHRHSALEKLMIGSTTEAVLRRAACDVLAVPIALLDGVPK